MTAVGLINFEPGAVYDVAAEGAIYRLALDKAQALPDSGREGGSFRLEFVGPAAPLLPQATYHFSSNGEPGFEMFIVPIAHDAKGVRYEAVFY